MRNTLRFLGRFARIAFVGDWRYYAWMGTLSVLVLLGLNAYCKQFVAGLVTTGMSDEVSWGVYIANFTFLVGVAAAAVMMVIPVYIYDNEEMHDLVIFGELLAVAAIIMCLAFVTVDLGRPDRFWHLIPGLGKFNFPASMLSWDVIVLNGYLVLNVWICGYVKNADAKKDDNQCLKFTKDGKFLLQIGHSGQSKGSLDTENLNHATKVIVWPKTNEAFISDGYVNRRVIVFDADTGKFKRLWGAYGNKPDDSAPRARSFDGAPPQQFNNVHGVEISNDGLVYVNDRQNNRVQVFTIDGKYVTQKFIDRWCEAPHCGNGQTVASTAFSQDPEQRFLYVASRSPARIWVLDRKTLEPLDSFGRPGVAPGEFYVMHHMNVDAKGNLYVTEVQDGKRVQKFVYKGTVQVPVK